MISDGENSEPDCDNSDSTPWEGYCLDDGTGQNVHYVNVNETQTRKKPKGFKFELFDNGDRRYYNRGKKISSKQQHRMMALKSTDIQFNDIFFQQRLRNTLILSVRHMHSLQKSVPVNLDNI